LWQKVTNGRAGILFGDRTGGVSSPPFDTANAAFGRGDDPAAVAENRRRLGAALGGPAFDPDSWTCLHQVHGVGVAASGPTGGVLPEADAAVTTDPEATLAILTADCGPVALVAPGATAAVHAGWRGVAAGVLEATVARLADLSPVSPEAFVGPCVRPCCYEFKATDLEPIVARFGPSVVGTTRTGTLALDVPAAIRAALARAGITDVSDSGVCTSCSPDHFSHRRDGRTGLQLMLVSGPRS
jgi:YfiH family protein